MVSGSHFAMTGTSCRSGALAASYRAPGSLRDMHIGKDVFNCVVLCVDRHSSYVVAVLVGKKGLLAKEVAVTSLPPPSSLADCL